MRAECRSPGNVQRDYLSAKLKEVQQSGAKRMSDEELLGFDKSLQHWRKVSDKY